MFLNKMRFVMNYTVKNDNYKYFMHFCQKCIKVSVICKTTQEVIKKEGEKKIQYTFELID
jgi:hypothetical protein